MKRLTESHLLSECSSHIANTFGTSLGSQWSGEASVLVLVWRANRG